MAYPKAKAEALDKVRQTIDIVALKYDLRGKQRKNLIQEIAACLAKESK